MKKLSDESIQSANEELKKSLEKASASMEKMKQDLEARSREAQIELALEKIRARTMAMKKSEELAETVSLLFKQLIDLGIPATQMRTCAIVTLEPDKPMGECWITGPDGAIIPHSFRVPYDETSAYKAIYAAWKNGEKFLVVNLSGDALVQHLNFLKKYARIPTQQFQALPDQQNQTFTHAMFFMQGYLFIISNEPLPEYHGIFKRFGTIFQQTYTRFLDLQKVESAKLQIEKTLADLKQTQSQLVQAEKMASLGELTAGIAHEIQNPLNFVNNFSEVNQELISEMKEEMLKGNLEEATELATQIGDNEIKILHHGKRADAIVKSMLLHSQSGTGRMEPTDITALADEYLHLAYHGIRAKDKSFMASMQTDYDQSISPINLVPQDIGRVMLNLFNNAFYAVNEKKKGSGSGYEPMVSVSTIKANGRVEIRVKDNANGIPQKILDKIFQPFFTTKPTGEGTGLGLSLSYDIIKAHQGEIKVNTKEGEFTEFVIQIPAV